ncbi:MAG: tRNA (adenosine(37)-N6)-threonylcarbamoyltransferase complex ATPase subunit type 1 TsaE [Puniceicoccales bacterium]|nr:tRNA (adenosine(37)-N6)-threonylcarbamoyltransferase complex ATPase subunit type 1 TsaE [Puniceicoccales bacterium]
MTLEYTVAREVCGTVEETISCGEKFSRIVQTNSSVALIGDIGSGKTTFVKGLARGFATAECASSPSFNILNLYRGNVTLLHVDAYRLDGSRKSALDLMLDDFLEPPYCLVVEWPELLHGFLEACDYKISFASPSHSIREITIKKCNLSHSSAKDAQSQ